MNPGKISLPFLAIWLVLLAPMILAFILGIIGLIRHIRERRRPRTAVIVLFSVGMGSLIISGILTLLSRYAGLHFYLLHASWYNWSFGLMCIGTPSLCFAALCLGAKEISSWRSILHILWMSFSLILLGLVLLFGHGSTSYTEIASPAEAGQVHELVFEEQRWLTSEACVVYEKVSFCFMRKLGSCPSSVPYFIRQNEVDFEWHEDGFTIRENREEIKFTYLP